MFKKWFQSYQGVVTTTSYFLMHQSCQTLIENDIQIYSVKTDALTVEKSDMSKANELFNFNDGLGSSNLSKENNIILPARQWNLVINHETEIKQLEIHHLDVPDEWDTKAVCKRIQEHKRVMVRAEYAGCGKSYAARYMNRLKIQSVICMPYQ